MVHESPPPAGRLGLLLHRYASAIVHYPCLFSLFLSALTVVLISVAFTSTPEGYLDFSDPMLGFSPKGTDLNGRIQAKKRVIWPEDLKLTDNMFFDTPGEAAWERSQHPEWSTRRMFETEEERGGSAAAVPRRRPAGPQNDWSEDDYKQTGTATTSTSDTQEKGSRGRGRRRGTTRPAEDTLRDDGTPGSGIISSGISSSGISSGSSSENINISSSSSKNSKNSNISNISNISSSNNSSSSSRLSSSLPLLPHHVPTPNGSRSLEKVSDDLFVFGPFVANWWDANNFCKRHGRTIVTVNSKSAQDAVAAMSAAVEQCVWIGGSDLITEGQFQWIGDPDIPFDSFTNWNDGEPNNWASRENCIELCYDSGGGLWNDNSCSNALPFVCGPSDGGTYDDDWSPDSGTGIAAPYDLFVCPNLVKDGDEHISLLFGYVDANGDVLSSDDFDGGSIVSAAGLREICELDAAVRDYSPEGKSRGGYFFKTDFTNTCTLSPIDGWKHCCASRSVLLPYEVMLKSEVVDASKGPPGSDLNLLDEPYWNPFEELTNFYDIDKSPFVTTSLCGGIEASEATEKDYSAAAKYLNEMFRTCAPYFAAEPNTLAACALAEDYISNHQNDLSSEDAILAFGMLMKCEIEVPHECLVGAGSGALDAMLSLIPKQYARHLAKGGGGGGDSVHILRTMIPVKKWGEEESYMEYKKSVLEFLDKKSFYATGAPLHGVKGRAGVALIGFSVGIKRDIFVEAIVRDVGKAVGAMFCVFALMWWYTRSFAVTTLSFLEILSSLGVGYFIYVVVLGLKFFPFMNVVTLFLAIGIGADDVFVYIDCWRLSLVEVPFEYDDESDTTPPPPPPRSLFHPLRYISLVPKLTPSQKRHQTLRLEYTLRHAGASTFHTSFTTSAAFLTNCTSNITTVKCFGLYAALVVISDYVMMITFLPAIVCIFDRTVCGEERFARQVRHPTATNTRYPKAPQVSPDDSCNRFLSPPVSQAVLSIRESVRRLLAILESYSVRLFTEFIPTVLLGPPPPANEVANNNASSSSSSSSSSKTFPSVLDGLNEYLPRLWLVALGLMGFSGMIISLWAPGLTLPPYSGYQLYADKNPMEVLEIGYMDSFASASVEGRTWEIEFFFGMGRKDNSDVWDPMSPGTNQMIPLRLGKKDSQQFFSDFSDALQSLEFYGKSEEWMPFFMPAFKLYIFRPCTPDSWSAATRCCGYSDATFPLEEEVFDKCFIEWCENNNKSKRDQGVFFDRDGKLAVIHMFVPTTLKFSLKKAETEKFWSLVQDLERKWITGNDSLKGTGLNKGWAWTQLQVYDVQVAINQGVTSSLLLSFFIAIVTVYLTTMSVAITCTSGIAISCILGCTIAVLIKLGWYLSIGESIVFSLAVGLSIDFCVHYGWAVIMALSREKESEMVDTAAFKRRLVVASLTEMGSSVAMGASTTVFAGLVMSSCETLFFIRLGTFLYTVMGFSWLYSTFFFQALIAVTPQSILRLKLRGIPGLLFSAYRSVAGRGSAVVSSSAAVPGISLFTKRGFGRVLVEDFDTIEFEEDDRPFPTNHNSGIQMQSRSAQL